ncbi:MAG TPA: tetratricopeptide repeat protein, partial [Gemmataceae bacterium]|nr:tetratricopeptide repeat protein [Gemmataceae bacterium]
LQVQQGDLDYAGYLWSCAQKDHPDKLLILEALARAFMRTYQYRSAQACLEQWLDVQPRSLQALLWLGQLHRTLSEYAQAIALYGRAVALDPESDEARLNLAEILIYTHKAPEALRQFEILAERQPGNVAVVLGQARCKAELSETEEARKLFDRLVGVKPDDATILAESGKLLLNAGQVVEAETRLRAALRLAPNEREALYSMYKCLEQQGKKEEAHKYLDQCNRVERDLDRCKALASKIMQGDSNPAPRCELARILMRNGLWDEARRWLDDAIRVDSKHQEIYLLFADYYEHAGQSAVAARCRALAAELAAPAR